MFEDHGSAGLFRPLTPGATDWLRENAPRDAHWATKKEALIVERRDMGDLMDAIVRPDLPGQPTGWTRAASFDCRCG